MIGRVRTMVWVGAVILLISGVANPVAAQSPERASITAGYQLVHIPDKIYPVGGDLDLALPIGGATWHLVAEVGVAHDPRSEAGGATAINFLNFGAGVRWSGTGHGTVGPFIQLLAGGIHTSANLSDPTNPTGTRSASDTGFMVQPGLGVAFPINGIWGGVVQADYRRVWWPNGPDENEARLLLGIRLSVR